MNHIGRVKIIKESFNIMDCLCICPHCNREAYYKDLRKVSGINCCPYCNEQLHYQIESDKKKDYNIYMNKSNTYAYEPYRYQGED